MNDCVMFRIQILILTIIVLSLGLSSCGEEEDIINSGEPIIKFLEDSYSGPRGSTVLVQFTAEADNGLASISIEINDTVTDFNPLDQTKFEAVLDFVIPGNAILNQEYPVIIDVMDNRGNHKTTRSVIRTSPVIEEVPTTYHFDRDGQSSVSYTGQDDRLRQVEEIKAYLVTGDAGQVISAEILSDAYANTNGNGNGFFSFTSSKQLENKSFAPDLDNGFMSGLFSQMAEASTSRQVASNGKAGLIYRENADKTILVDSHGREFTQLIEKGLMGTVMYHQIYNTYFSEERIGDQVENTQLRDGTNYTDMEHHWDEAFGYFNPPLDFSSNWPENRKDEVRFWSHYSNVIDPHLGTNELIMRGFIQGRTAIVNNDPVTKNEEKMQVANYLDLVAAGTAIHYINATLRSLNSGHTGEVFHTLSEAWAFVNALKYNPDRRLSLDEIEQIKEMDFGEEGNFWNVSATGLNKAKNTIVSYYPELENSKDVL